MRLSRTIAAVTTVVATVFGLGLATAGSAAAAAGQWQAYGNTNPVTSSSSTWQCHVTVTFDVSVHAQVCAVRSSSGTHVQGAVIVRNNRSSLYSANAEVTVRNVFDTNLGTWTCSYSGVAANSWSVCFGSTFGHTGPVHALGYASSVALGVTSDV